jgi:tRNA threonylcarbamoyladenosine biosynthesis protein TsaE
MPTQITTATAGETRHLGRLLGRLLEPGDVVALSGELGAGKTTLAQGICTGLDVSEPVASPTFTLVHEYAGRVPVWHLDTYRLRSSDELIDLSWQDLLSGGGVVLVEWPERVADALPPDRLEVALAAAGVDERRLTLTACGERWERVLVALETVWRKRVPDEVRNAGAGD